MEKISLADCVRNEVLRTVEEEMNTLHQINRRASWIGHILRRNYLLKHVDEGKVDGKIDVT